MNHYDTSIITCVHLHPPTLSSRNSSTALANLGRFFSFLIHTQWVGLLWTGDQPIPRPPPTHRTTQTQNTRTQRSMFRMGFEHTIPVFERANMVHALDRAATVIGWEATYYTYKIKFFP
jgi:hypothetical protein